MGAEQTGPTVKVYDFNGRSGCVMQRRSRDTGALIGLYHAGQAGMDTEAGAWATVCEDHGTTVNHARLADARAWMAEPSIWCDGCGRLGRNDPEASSSP